MAEIKSRLNEPPPFIFKPEGEALFILILTKAPYHGTFDIHNILLNIEKLKEFDFNENRKADYNHLFADNHTTTQDRERSYTQWLIRNGFAKPIKETTIKFNDSGRELKRLGSFADYKKHIEDELRYKKVIRNLPNYQKRYNLITVSFICISCIATTITCWNNNRTYEIQKNRFTYDTLHNTHVLDTTNHKTGISTGLSDTIQIEHRKQEININISSPK